MARAIWSGSVSFGLVNIPVKMYSGVRDHSVHFHQLDKKSGSRIRYEKVAEKTGKEVAADQVDLGYEVDKGKLVVVDPGELDRLRPQTTRTIDITDFVELSEVDPAYYNRTYWLVPDGERAARAYGLLVAAMEDRNRVGVGMVVMRNKQYLAAIRPREGALAMSTMRFADEVVSWSEINGQPPTSFKIDPKELRLATQIIDSLAGPWKPQRYKDTYTEEVRRLIRAHEKGQDVVVEEAPAARAERVDLMEALEASLKAARSRGDRNKELEKAAERFTEQAEQGDGPDTSAESRRGSRTRGGARHASADKSNGRGRTTKDVPAKGSARRRKAPSSRKGA
jgi:DNA end-binding protein Ku